MFRISGAAAFGIAGFRVLEQFGIAQIYTQQLAQLGCIVLLVSLRPDAARAVPAAAAAAEVPIDAAASGGGCSIRW